ncbi:MAG: acyl carrier protein [Acidimicrobiia bacterium]
MTHDEAEAVVRDAIARVAPDVDATALHGDVELRGDLDLDSMDFLNVMIAIAEKTGIEIAERDYPDVGTFSGLVDHLSRS